MGQIPQQIYHFPYWAWQPILYNKYFEQIFLVFKLPAPTNYPSSLAFDFTSKVKEKERNKETKGKEKKERPGEGREGDQGGEEETEGRKRKKERKNLSDWLFHLPVMKPVCSPPCICNQCPPFFLLKKRDGMSLPSKENHSKWGVQTLWPLSFLDHSSPSDSLTSQVSFPSFLYFSFSNSF